MLRYSEQAAPSSTRNLAIVFLDAPVIRTIERIEQPSNQGRYDLFPLLAA